MGRLIEYNFGVPCKVEKYNSCNAWGFGGSVGQKYIFNDNLYCLVARTSHRNGGLQSPLSTNFIEIWHNKDHIFDRVDTPKNMKDAKELIKNILKT